jgi:hypothetical protein
MRAQVASMQTALAKAAQDLTATSSKLAVLEEDNQKLLKQVAEPRRQIDELMARIREMKAANDHLAVLERELRAWVSQVGPLGIAQWVDTLQHTYGVGEELADEWQHSEFGLAKMLWHVFGQEPYSQTVTNWLDEFMSPVRFTPVRSSYLR